jgi:hypothetical protein
MSVNHIGDASALHIPTDEAHASTGPAAHAGGKLPPHVPPVPAKRGEFVLRRPLRLKMLVPEPTRGEPAEALLFGVDHPYF